MLIVRLHSKLAVCAASIGLSCLSIITPRRGCLAAVAHSSTTRTLVSTPKRTPAPTNPPHTSRPTNPPSASSCTRRSQPRQAAACMLRKHLSSKAVRLPWKADDGCDNNVIARAHAASYPPVTLYAGLGATLAGLESLSVALATLSCHSQPRQKDRHCRTNGSGCAGGFSASIHHKSQQVTTQKTLAWVASDTIQRKTAFRDE